MNISLIMMGLTDMKGEFRCISGYHKEKSKYFRPLLNPKNGRRIDHNFCTQITKEIKLFIEATFEVESFFDNPESPHIEDFYISRLIEVKEIFQSRKQIKDFLHQISDSSIKSVYGDFIEIINGSPVVPEDCGHRSLGTIVAKSCKVYKNNLGRVRVDIIDQTGYQLNNLPCVAHDMEYKKVGKYNNIPVRLGLTRLWKKDKMDEEYYWIQISEVFP